MANPVRPQNVAYGVVLIVATALTISVQDVVFKFFSDKLGLWQIFTLRGLIALPMLVVLAWIWRRNTAVISAALGLWPILRGVFITLTFLAFYAAIPFLSLSTVGAANYISPIFVALLSAYVIRESVGLLGWLGVFVGFAGIVILLQPGTDAFSAWALLPVFGAACYAIGHIITRTRCQDVPLAAMALSLNAMMLLAGLIVSGVLIVVQPGPALAEENPYIFGSWSSVGLTDWAVLALLAGFSVTIGMMLAGAYQAAPPAIISTFEYSYLVFVAIWDILFFAVSPTFSSVTGMVLVVAAGLLVLQRRTQGRSEA